MDHHAAESHCREVSLKAAHRVAARCHLRRGSDSLAGSDPAHPLSLVGEGILPTHAEFALVGHEVLVAPQAPAAVWINGRAVTDRMPVRDGDCLVLGKTPFQVFLGECRDCGTTTDDDALRFGLEEHPAPIIVGRLRNCHLTIDSPLVSREHARLRLQPEGVWLEDLRSTNGTFVNGSAVTAPVRLTPGDHVAFATFVYRFSGTALLPLIADGRVRIEARDLSKTVTDRTTRQPRRLLDGVDLVIEPGEFVVIFWTSGSGKSTLLDSLNGRRPATSGQVLYNGIDLYDSFAAFRSGIGYVPQQDIVHRRLGVARALHYTARLRLPGDTSRRETALLIDRVLGRVGLRDQGQLLIDTPEPLSGGQLKRVNLAVELVANPSVLFLDEATSGLDAGTDRRLMRLFAELAADGKTVICVTHTLENIGHCHLVALLHQGILVYYGPPGDLPQYFGISRLAEVYEHLDGQHPQHWAQRFRDSPHYREFVRVRQSAPVVAAARIAEARPPALPGSAPRGGWPLLRQAATLIRRYSDLLLADRLHLAVLLLQAPLIALLVGAIFDTSGSLAERAQGQAHITFVLVLSAIWFGGINSCREIVKERPVYLRERAVGLSIPAYMLSKVLPLAALCAAQCLGLLAIVTLMLDFPGSLLERWLVLFLTGLAATGMGLAVSAFVTSNDKAIAALPLLLIPQFILSNAIVPLTGIALTAAKGSVIAYWGVDALRTTLEEPLRALRAPDGSAMIPINGDWATDCLALCGLTLAFLTLATVGLRLSDRRI